MQAFAAIPVILEIQNLRHKIRYLSQNVYHNNLASNIISICRASSFTHNRASLRCKEYPFETGGPRLYSRLHRAVNTTSQERRWAVQCPRLREFQTSSLSSNTSSPNTDSGEKKVGLFKRFKLMYKQYWYVLIPVHCFTSAIWFGGFFFASKSGVDIGPFLEYIGTPEYIMSHMRDSNAGHLAVALGMYKVATPARYMVTLAGTTLSIKYLKERNYIKPVPSAEELKVMYQDRKEVLLEKKDEMKEKYQDKKEEMFEKYQDRREEIIEKYQERREEVLEKYQEKKEEVLDKYQERKEDVLDKYKKTKEGWLEKYRDKKDK